MSSSRARLFLAVLLFQLTFASGHMFSYDEVSIEDLAASIVDHGSGELHFGPRERLYYKPGPHGEQYSKFGIGMSAALIPFYVAGKVIGMATRSSDVRLAADIVASFANAVIVALVAPCFFTTLKICGIDERAAVVTTLLLLFCTTLAVYGRGLFNDALTGLAVILSVEMLLADRPAWSGAAAAIAFATRAEYGLLIPALLVFVPWRRWPRYLAPTVAIGLVLALYNFARFGSPTDQGTLTDNPGDVFSTPIHVGLFGLLASPGKGILWYSAPVLLSAWGCVTLWKRDRRLLGIVAAVVVPLLLLHAHWHSWMGGWSYGPRRLVALLPVLMIPAAFVVSKLMETKRGIALVVATAVLGFAAQVAGLSTNFMHYIQWANDHQVSTLWSFEHSSMIGQVHWLFGTGQVDIWYVNLFGLTLLSGLIGFLLAAATTVSLIHCLAAAGKDLAGNPIPEKISA